MTYGLVGKKYVSRINLRMQLPKGSSVDFWVQYDSDGVWRHCGHIEGRGCGRSCCRSGPRGATI